MSTTARVDSDSQLARLLQIGIVLEEVVEARAYQHYQQIPADDRESEIESLLEEARSESAEHRRKLESLIDGLEAQSIPYDEIKPLVVDQYAKNQPEDFDGILYDQLHGEETAYKFYDDLIQAIEEGDARFSIDRSQLLSTLK
ncbi:MAG: ferritin-like domain-containing protein, partial [Halobacteriaceae archaeon]